MGETAGAVVAVGADMVHCPFLNFDDEKSFEAQEKRGSLGTRSIPHCPLILSDLAN